MLKIFLVEDESIMREPLRDNMPWQQFGYEFVGEAADGETALTLIRKTRPDVLLTDIKMPFMDGLSLSRIVAKEFPNMKIIILLLFQITILSFCRSVHQGVQLRRNQGTFPYRPQSALPYQWQPDNRIPVR